MQHSRALARLCNPARCYKQGVQFYSTNSPFASFISDVKIPESVAETRRSAPRLSSLGDIEIPSIIPSSTTSLFAARAAQRQRRQLVEAAPKQIEAKVVNTPKPTRPVNSLLSRRSQSLPKNERLSSDGPSNPQTSAHLFRKSQILPKDGERLSGDEPSNTQTVAHLSGESQRPLKDGERLSSDEPSNTQAAAHLSRKSERLPKDGERLSSDEPSKTQAAAHLSRKSERLPKDGERLSSDEPSNTQTAVHLSRKSERFPENEDTRSNDEPRIPQTAAHPRLKRPLPAVTRSAQTEMRTNRRREAPRVPKPSRVVKPTSPAEDLNEDHTSAPPTLHVSFNNTNLSELFSTSVLIPYVAQPSVAQSRIDSRVQLLKERAGDYSRYLPGDVESTTQTQGSVDYAKLILARRREIGLKPRRAAVELMHQAGLSSTSVSATSS
ncbi:hypothetical protein BDR04DRAFT_1089206 [Suillus decipiens]|nr:hypothetical protein BDR04DRAFT_1089206 [Suillus decipiens]